MTDEENIPHIKDLNSVGSDIEDPRYLIFTTLHPETYYGTNTFERSLDLLDINDLMQHIILRTENISAADARNKCITEKPKLVIVDRSTGLIYNTPYTMIH